MSEERIKEERLRFENIVRRKVYIIMGMGIIQIKEMEVGEIEKWNVEDKRLRNEKENNVKNEIGYKGEVL